VRVAEAVIRREICEELSYRAREAEVPMFVLNEGADLRLFST
jgi:hypothetical protein